MTDLNGDVEDWVECWLRGELGEAEFCSVMKRLVREAVAREREACALIADTTVQLEGWNNVADAIRARGQEMNHDAR